MGRRSRVPTPEEIARIEKLAGLGCTLDQIAAACDISPSTLDKWKGRKEVEAAYRKGRVEATSAIAERLYNLAMDGDVAACIFWLKAQAGWSDKPQPEAVASADVQIYLPDNGRDSPGSPSSD